MRYPVWCFLRLVWEEWSSRVTGSLSALLVLLGLGISVANALGFRFESDSWVQIASWILAAVCGGQAAYSVWAKEHKEKSRLQERLRAKLRLEYSPQHTIRAHPNGVKQTFVAAFNDSEIVITGVEVKVEDITFKQTPDLPYLSTNFNSRVNLGWCCKEDGNDQKFSGINLPPGRELLDFIAGPYPLPILVNGTPQSRPGFRVILHPGHWAFYASFWKPGIYKVVMQISGQEAGAPTRLVCIVDWDGNDFSISPEAECQAGV